MVPGQYWNKTGVGNDPIAAENKILVRCSCKNCSVGRCSCRCNHLPCTGACSCGKKNCNRVYKEIDDNYDDDDGDDDDDDDDDDDEYES